MVRYLTARTHADFDSKIFVSMARFSKMLPVIILDIKYKGVRRSAIPPRNCIQ